MVKRTSLVSLALLCAAGVTGAWAQQRPITGRVFSAVTGEGLSGASVSVLGSAIAAVTGGDGTFSLSAPEGSVTLLVRLIGYKRRQMAVAPDAATVSVGLDQDVFNLEAVVVTGQATGVEQRNLANAVATVQAEEVARAPAQTVESALQGKVPGAVIQQNSGAPGGGIQVNLRGVSTIIGRSAPLWVVDGIVVSDAEIPNGQGAVTASQAGGNPNNQDDRVNRTADLIPGDVERVEVLKGASAAAIYGSKATNGVVLVTTRRGEAGAPRFHISQRFGTFALANKIGLRSFGSLAEARSVSRDTVLIDSLFALGQVNDFEEQLYGRKDLSTETVVSVSGGSEQTRYYVSGLVKNDAGIAANTGYQKQSVRANLDQRLSDRLQLSLGTNVVHSLAQRGISNNDNAGTSPYLVFPFTYNFAGLSPTGPQPLDYPNNPFERSNPLQTFDFLNNDEDTWRAISSATARWDAVAGERQALQLIVTGGFDHFIQRNTFFSPPELEYEPQDGLPGTLVDGRATNTNLSLAGHAVHTYRPASGGYVATTSAGVQWEERNLNATQTVGRNLPPGQQNIDLATSINLSQERRPVRDLGLFAQEEVLLADERVLLTLGVRADRSSVNGDPDKYHVFPKAAASYRFVQPASWMDELKLRAAFGQTGNPPVFGAKYIADTTGTISGRLGVYAGQRVGDPNIEPERQTEIEAGFDAALRLPLLGPSNLTFTVYQKKITDLLVEQTLPPSMGNLTRVFNGGELRNRGIEIGLAFTPVQTADVNWVFRTTFFANRSKVLDLAVPAFETGGFGTSLGTFKLEEGKSATQIIGSEGVVGDANPDFIMSFSSDVDYGPWSLGFLFDWKKGGDVINLTELLFDAGANSADFVATGRDRFTRWIGGETKVYVQDGSYFKLREVSLSYRLPSSATAWLFGSRTNAARISFSGRNLLRFTPYRGLDPEVSNFGNQPIFRNIDVAPFPPSRSYWLSIDLDF